MPYHSNTNAFSKTFYLVINLFSLLITPPLNFRTLILADLEPVSRRDRMPSRISELCGPNGSVTTPIFRGFNILFHERLLMVQLVIVPGTGVVR